MKIIKTLKESPLGFEIVLAEENGKKVVIKKPKGTITPDKEKILNYEAEILKKLQKCPYIIKIIDIKKPPREEFQIIFEYAPKTLKEEIPNLTIPKALEFAEQILTALECMHKNGIIHGDLNPNNILIGEDGKIRIIDFESVVRRKLLKQKPYTPKYTAPEQIDTTFGEIDERTDIFQFGCILYEMIEKKPVFTDNWREEIQRGKHIPYEKIPDLLHYIIDKCLEPSKGERWSSITDLKSALIIAKKALPKSVLEPKPKQEISIQSMEKLKKVISIELGGFFNFDPEKHSLVIDLSDSYIDSNKVQKVSQVISELKQLTSLTLDLSSNKINDVGARFLALAIAELEHLTSLTLNLRYNSIGYVGARALASAISKLKQLISLTLDLYSNNIGDKGAKALALAIAELEHLTSLTLNLGWNGISGVGAEALRKLRKRFSFGNIIW